MRKQLKTSKRQNRFRRCKECNIAQPNIDLVNGGICEKCRTKFDGIIKTSEQLWELEKNGAKIIVIEIKSNTMSMVNPEDFISERRYWIIYEYLNTGRKIKIGDISDRGKIDWKDLPGKIEDKKWIRASIKEIARLASIRRIQEG